MSEDFSSETTQATAVRYLLMKEKTANIEVQYPVQITFKHEGKIHKWVHETTGKNWVRSVV